MSIETVTEEEAAFTWDNLVSKSVRKFTLHDAGFCTEFMPSGQVASNLDLRTQIFPTTRQLTEEEKAQLKVGTLPKKFAKSHKLEDFTEPTVTKKKETSVNCKNCGKPLKSVAKFCGKCGTPRD